MAIKLSEYINHIFESMTDALSYIEGMVKDDFLMDKRTQQAVILNLINMGEAATKIMDKYPYFAQDHSEIPWRSMRNMRNRIAHGYFNISLEVVWETASELLPNLIEKISALQMDMPSIPRPKVI